MLGYRDRRIRDDLFASLGRTDITHHVNFDHLEALLQKAGWRKDGEIEQYRFLHRAGVLERLGGLTVGRKNGGEMAYHARGSRLDDLGAGVFQGTRHTAPRLLRVGRAGRLSAPSIKNRLGRRKRSRHSLFAHFDENHHLHSRNKQLRQFFRPRRVLMQSAKSRSPRTGVYFVRT